MSSTASSFVLLQAAALLRLWTKEHTNSWIKLATHYRSSTKLEGETRKVETDRVAVGTFSGEGLSPVFQERAPWSIMDETNKAREHKKA